MREQPRLELERSPGMAVAGRRMTLVYGGVMKACTWILRAGMNGFTREGGGGGASETKVPCGSNAHALM